MHRAAERRKASLVSSRIVVTYCVVFARGILKRTVAYKIYRITAQSKKGCAEFRELRGSRRKLCVIVAH